MSEIIGKGIDDLMKGEDINYDMLQDLFVIVRHQFKRSIYSEDEMAFKLFKIYYAFYHQH